MTKRKPARAAGKPHSKRGCAAAPAAAAAAPLSLRAYAKLRGVSAEAVSKAISTGRLAKSIVRVAGAPKIADRALADQEWDANTQQRADQAAAAPPRDTPEYLAHRTARESAAARREAAQAEMAELELAERRGQLIGAEEARADVLAAFSLVKSRLLGVPTAVGQRLPDLAERIVPVVDKLVREALEELAARKGAPAAAVDEAAPGAGDA